MNKIRTFARVLREVEKVRRATGKAMDDDLVKTITKAVSKPPKKTGGRGKNIPRDVKQLVWNYIEEEFGGDIRGEEGGWRAAFESFSYSPKFTSRVHNWVGGWESMRRIAEAARASKRRKKSKPPRQKK